MKIQLIETNAQTIRHSISDLMENGNDLPLNKNGPFHCVCVFFLSLLVKIWLSFQFVDFSRPMNRPKFIFTTI